MQISTAKELIAELKSGNMVILLDDENRENEGDLVVAADFVSPERLNFMLKHARGLMCLCLDPGIVDRLNLPLMKSVDSGLNTPAFTYSMEAASGISTGVSVSDRAYSIKVAISPNSSPSDIVTPGHVFPLKAHKNGVLGRRGHTEGSVDLCRLAGLTPAAVICEVLNEDGEAAKAEDLQIIAAKFQLKIGTIDDLVRYRLESVDFVQTNTDNSLQ